jgi:hypothetical protein
LAVLAIASTHLKADTAAPAASTITTQAAAAPAVTVPTPKWFNGNWFAEAAKPGYGAPDDTIAPTVKAQQDAYTAAKTKDDLDGKLANAFWSSVQAWAFNNAARKAMADNDFTAAADLLEKGLAVLDAVPELSADVPKGAADGEKGQRALARKKLESNKTYVDAQLAK